MIRWTAKDPADETIYEMDFADAIAAGDGLASSVWAVAPTGPTLTGQSPVGDVAKVKIAGGTAGVNYVVTCTATLTSAQIIQKNVLLPVREQ